MPDEQEIVAAAPLAATLAALMRDQRIWISHVARVSGLARNTIVYVLTGKTRRPSLPTLARIALAIGTDPTTREVSRETMKKAERMLAIAAGYADPEGGDALTWLELAFYYNLNSREQARAWADTFERLRALDADAVRALTAVPRTDR